MNYKEFYRREKIYDTLFGDVYLDYNIRWDIYTGNIKSINTYIKDLKKKFSFDALLLACQYNNIDILKHFLENGFNPDMKEGELLIFLCRLNLDKPIDLLLKYGANPNHQRGKALYLASYNRCEPIVNLLLKHGANIKYIYRKYDGLKSMQKQTLLMGLRCQVSKIYQVFILAELSERYLLKTIMSYL